ncbi:rod shape-determining protein MreD [Bacillus alkalisoli]|uniref:rod shape-determining protein MreD n=1 Tax=Bacillus alkalisoli TaxID=2011008 RepID=UPI000C246613|nr:rod shape-determining protein MreD [Bacillus alkalisoli]
MRRYFLPVIIIFLFVFESLAIDFFPLHSLHEDWIIAPRFVLIALIFITIYGGLYFGIVYSLVFGFLIDIVYTGIMGIYIFSFTLVAYGAFLLMRIIHNHALVAVFAAVISVVFVEYTAYNIHSIIGSTRMMHDQFLYTRLLPTLLFNATAAIILIYPLKKFLNNLVLEMNEE